MTEDPFKNLRILPPEFEKPMKHLIRAKIEYLKALNSFIEALIGQLEKLVEEEKQEKLKVE